MSIQSGVKHPITILNRDNDSFIEIVDLYSLSIVVLICSFKRVRLDGEVESMPPTFDRTIVTQPSRFIVCS